MKSKTNPHHFSLGHHHELAQNVARQSVLTEDIVNDLVLEWANWLNEL